MDARLLSFRKLYKHILAQDKLDVNGVSLLLSVLVYFSNEFIEKICKELNITTLTVVEINGLKFIYVKYMGQEFIAFRGTEFSLWSNTKRALNFIPKKTKSGKKAHRGFVMAFADCDKVISELISVNKSVIFTGHSLGGALALIAAEHYKACAIAFASPLVFFNEKLLDSVNYLGYRVLGDFVPNLPPSFFFAGWSRAKPEFWIKPKVKFLNCTKYHHVSTYITVLMDEFYSRNISK
ncbi:lipase [Xanthomonas phage Xoo-sp13]|nr:lipase [Xanthomonas phage Xoo-sp13]